MRKVHIKFADQDGKARTACYITEPDSESEAIMQAVSAFRSDFPIGSGRQSSRLKAETKENPVEEVNGVIEVTPLNKTTATLQYVTE